MPKTEIQNKIKCKRYRERQGDLYRQRDALRKKLKRQNLNSTTAPVECMSLLPSGSCFELTCGSDSQKETHFSVTMLKGDSCKKKPATENRT